MKGTYNIEKKRIYIAMPNSTGVDRAAATEIDENGLEWELSYSGRRIGVFIYDVELDVH
jgi:hypothetical protein